MSDGVYSKSGPEVVEKLNILLANLIVLRTKLANAGFNVVSPNYEQYRTLFIDSNREIEELVIKFGERIRSLNSPVMMSLKTILDYNKDAVKEWHPSGGFFMKLRDVEMLKTVVGDFETIVKRCMEYSQSIEKIGDRSTADYIDHVTRKLQKIQWIFRSHLAGHERRDEQVDGEQ